MQQAELLRVLSKDSAALRLPTNAVVCVVLAVPMDEATYVRAVRVSPLQPMACEVALGPYDLRAKGFTDCAWHLALSQADSLCSRRMPYKRMT